MALNANRFLDRTARIARHPRTRKTAAWLVSITVALGLLIGVAAPPLLRGKMAADLSERLHREVTIERVGLNPYAMTATVRGLRVSDRDSQSTALSFEELHVNLQLQSLWRWGPVIKELRLVKPYVHVIRNEDSTYNFQDLIDEFTSAPRSEGPRARFAVNNIQIIDGKIDFDDRPEQTKHDISSIQLGIPFISSLPSYTDIFVKPSFSADINGAPLRITGESKPFHSSLESTVDLVIDRLRVDDYLRYAPATLNFRVPSGELNGRLAASFRAAKDSASVFTVTGDLQLAQLALEESGGAPLLKLARLDVSIGAIDLFAGKTTVKSVKADGLELHLVRGRDGAINIAGLIARPPEAEAPAPAADTKPHRYEIGEIALGSATLHLVDESAQGGFQTRFQDLNLAISGLTNEAGKQAGLELSFISDRKERFHHTGSVQLVPLRVEGSIQLNGLKPAALRPYYQNATALEIRDGSLDVSTRYRFESKNGQTDFKLSELNANLQALRLELPGQSQPLWRLRSLAIRDAALDMADRSLVIGVLEGKNGTGYVERDADGALNYTRVLRVEAPAPAKKDAAKADAPWKIEAKRIALDGFRVDIDDRAGGAPAKLNLSELFLRVENFSNQKNRPAKARLRARIDQHGLLRLSGTATANPVAAELAVEVHDVDVLSFQPYLGDSVNFRLTGGRFGTQGSLTLAGSGSGPAKVNYRGGVQLSDIGAVESANSQDLLKWKTLALDEIQFDSEPMRLRIGAVNLADFYSRLIIAADGRINLQNLRKQDEAPQEASAPETPAAAASENERAISIGAIHLQRGNINFSDFLIRPNYSANLTDVDGTISELTPGAPGTIALQARLDGAAPVDINGKINPLGKELFFDVNADAREIEMNSFSPYSGKYVGYGIEKGKLSFNVTYKVEDRKLSAHNKIILNQLTFGERVESPQATKLPVLLAVALLKDRNGVIDIDLPIGGSLDDPQFSVGGIILRLITNIITRAVTAPFTLLGSVFGAGDSQSGEELSYVEFDHGRSTLSPAAQSKISTLAKAMSNRPALRLELRSRVDPPTDVEGLKRLAIERKVKAQKLKELARGGDAPPSLDEVKIDGAEYPQYLRAAYRQETFPRPRNAIGLLRDLPVAEMEKLMMQHAAAGEEDLRRLADERAQAVRTALVAAGQIEAERLAIVAAQPLSGEERAKLKGRPNRVDFALR